MTFSVVSIAYKQEASSAAINQLMENIVRHDHRADGSQGAVLVGNWVDVTATLTAASGWSKLGTLRYRLLLGGAAVEYDFAFERTGGTLTASPDTGARPGNMTDTTILSGIPAGAAAPGQRHVTNAGGCPMLLSTSADGTSILVEAGTTNGNIQAGDQLSFRGVYWR